MTRNTEYYNGLKRWAEKTAKTLTAEQIVAYIASETIEMSYEKVIAQRDEFILLCRAWREKEAAQIEFDDDF